MRRMIEKIFASHGTDLTVTRGAEYWQTRGFLQPDISRAKQNMYPEFTATGLQQAGQYLFLGPAEPEVRSGDILVRGEERYLLRRVELLRHGEQPLYQWGLCTRLGGADTWPTLS